MPERNENEKKDRDDKDKYKMVPIIIRVPKWLLEAYDKTCPPNGRPGPIREFMRQRVATCGNEIPVNFEELKSEADKHKTEMENLMKKNPKIGLVLFRVHKKDVEGDHIPLVIEELTNNFKIEVKQGEEKFDDYDILQTVFYLKEKQAFEDAKRKLKKYLVAGSGKVEHEEPERKQRYIPIADLCDDSTCDIYHTKFEHQEQQRKEQEEREAEEREEEEERAKWEEVHPPEDDDFEEQW